MFAQNNHGSRFIGENMYLKKEIVVVIISAKRLDNTARANLFLNKYA